MSGIWASCPPFSPPVGVAEAYVRTGHRKWAILAGAVAGAAMGMVISSLLAFGILPVMTLLRRHTWRQRILLTLLAVGTGIAVYFFTNPYVAINLVRNRAVLRSNLGNTTNMYHVGGWIGWLQNGFSLLAEGASPGVLAGGWIAFAAWVVGYRNSRTRSAGLKSRPLRSPDVSFQFRPLAGRIDRFVSCAVSGQARHHHRRRPQRGPLKKFTEICLTSPVAARQINTPKQIERTARIASSSIDMRFAVFVGAF